MKTPTDEQMRIAIAEACGWKTDTKYNSPWNWLNPSGEVSRLERIPDYLNSLDAMHGVESVLPAMQYQLWLNELNAIVGRDISEGSPYWARNNESATARQRAEAFLRVLRPDLFA